MSFSEKMPQYYKEIKAQRANTRFKIQDLYSDIGEDDYSYHDCDCEYCPVPEKPNLTAAQRAEKEREIEKLEKLEDEYDDTIRALEGYAKLVNVSLQATDLSSEHNASKRASQFKVRGEER